MGLLTITLAVVLAVVVDTLAFAVPGTSVIEKADEVSSASLITDVNDDIVEGCSVYSVRKELSEIAISNNEPPNLVPVSTDAEIDNSGTSDTVEDAVLEPPAPTLIVEEVISSESTQSEQATASGEGQWWTQEEYDLLVQVVWCEAGSDGISDRAQQLVAMVVLNRMRGDSWPDTIYDVVYQQGQYGCLYSPNWGTTPTPRIYENVLAALNGEVECPSNVVYQSDCVQGSGQYERYETMWSPIVFCYK